MALQLINKTKERIKSFKAAERKDTDIKVYIAKQRFSVNCASAVHLEAGAEALHYLRRRYRACSQIGFPVTLVCLN